MQFPLKLIISYKLQDKPRTKPSEARFSFAAELQCLQPPIAVARSVRLRRALTALGNNLS